MTPGEQDQLWVLQIYPAIVDNDLEWFLERIAIKCDSGLTASQARNQTHTEYQKRLNERF